MADEKDLLSITRHLSYDDGVSGEYIINEDSKTIGEIFAFRNDALIRLKGKGTINPALDEMITNALISGKISKNDMEMLFKNIAPYCHCEPCTNKCLYEKRAE